MSRRIRRTRRVSASVSTKTFTSERRKGKGGNAMIHGGEERKKRRSYSLEKEMNTE